MPYNEKKKKKTVSTAALPRRKGISKTSPPKAPMSGAALASKTYTPERAQRELTSSIAAAAKAMPSGRYTGILKSALAGYAAGSEIGASISRYRASKKAKKAGNKSQGTVSDEATKQMSRAHKKDPTNTRRV